MLIAAPFERVASVVDDYGSYVGLFDGLNKVETLSLDGNRATTHWEEVVPLPFVPNEHNQMIHLVSTPRAGFKVYRYGLKKGDRLKSNDGVIVLEATSFGQTLYTEFDFFDADWGLAKSFGVPKLWKECLEGVYQSDYALKLRAEHIDWTSEKVRETSKQYAESMAGRPDTCPKTIFPGPEAK